MFVCCDTAYMLNVCLFVQIMKRGSAYMPNVCLFVQIMKRDSANMLFTGKVIPEGPNFIFPPTLIPQYLHLLEKYVSLCPYKSAPCLFSCAC